MKRVMCLFGVLLCVMLVVNGCGKKDDDGGKDTIKIGAIFDVTGKAAKLGDPEKKTALMLVDQINAKGGIDGKKIELIIEDTEGKGEKARDAVLKLIEKDNVIAIIGPTRSGSSLAIIDTINKGKTPNVSCAAAFSIVTPVDERKWVFKVPQTDTDCAMRIYECMNELGMTKMGIISGTTGFGTSGKKQLETLAAKYGIEIVANETYDPGDTQVTAQLTRIKEAAPDAVINWSILPTQSLIAKQMAEVGLEAQLFQSHGYGNIAFVKKGGDAANGTIFPCGALLVVDQLPDTHPRKGLLANYKKDYESKYNEDVSTFGGHAYDALSLVVKAIETVGPDKEKIRDYLETVNGDNAFSGTAGVFNMSKEDHCGLDKSSFEMITVEDGQFKLYKK